jgi:hypothetical protein
MNVNKVSLQLPDRKMIDVLIQGGNFHFEQTTWHPYFGVSTPNICLAAILTGPRIRTIIKWGVRD